MFNKWYVPMGWHSYSSVLYVGPFHKETDMEPFYFRMVRPARPTTQTDFPYGKGSSVLICTPNSLRKHLSRYKVNNFVLF